MKIYRTSSLRILEAWLIGGQVGLFGYSVDGFNSFTKEYNECLKNEAGEFDIDKIIEAIDALISEYGDLKIKCRHYFHKIKRPSDHNMRILAKRIKRYMTDWED